MLVPTPAPLPAPDPTTSYWQQPFSKLRRHRTTPELPSQAEYVVIGGGLSGSSLAYRILDKHPGAKVLLLEARDACSGASGRNGGHCRPGRYTTFVRDTGLYGAVEATAIARFEETNVRQLATFAQTNRIECTLEPVTTVDIFEPGTEGLLVESFAAVAARKAALAVDIAAGVADERTVYTASEAQERFKIPTSIGAISFPAYSINPYQFVCGVLELALGKGLNLQTGTPVTSITSSQGIWTVTTPRGTTRTPNVILATNAYTSHLLPQASRFIMPVRNQAVALRPGAKISKLPLLQNHSLCFVYGTNQPNALEGHDYLVSKPHKQSTLSSTQSNREERDLILGGGRHLAPNFEEFNTDDTTINVDVATYLHQALQTKHFGQDNWGGESHDDDNGIICDWTGIVGHTPDENPVLGPVPGRPGLWICAGFTGHGMALAFRSADAVSSLVLGREEEVRDWLPRSFLCGRKGVGVFGTGMGRA